MIAKATPKTKVPVPASPNLGNVSRCSSSNGVVCRAERRANHTPATTAITSRPAVRGDVQPQVGAWTNAPDTAATAAVTRTAPQTSGSGPVSRAAGRGSTAAPAINVARPIGRLTTNTQRQSISTSRPPTTGPAAAARPPTAAHPRVAAVRRSSVTVASSRAKEVGSCAAAPTAWTTRASTSTHSVGATAQPIEATVKTTTPPRNTGR